MRGPEPHTTYTKCGDPACEEKVADHRWGRTKAEGWFIQKDGKVWCPAHVPAWVASWRAEKKLQESSREVL